MFLKALEIYGFKSFPDKTRLTFERGLTAVVGPNGSGKSNISDAMRWVLGEQSTKSLRSSKMQDVIFGGTQQRGAMGFAQVSLVIDNQEGELAGIQAPEVTVTRKLYRSGESEYRINGAMVRLKDIHEMFMDTGLGKDGYSIIGQGRIAEIVAAKSDERREIFEEAAGIAKYRYKKTEAERKLARAEENLTRLQDIVDEIESRLEPLHRQSEKASEYLDLAARRRQIEISLWVHTLNKSRQLLRQQEDKLLICQNDLQRLDGEIAQIDRAAEDAFMQKGAISRRIDDINGQIAAIREQMSQNEASALVLQNEKKHVSESIERYRAQMGDIGVQSAQKDRQIADQQALIEKSRQMAAEREQQAAKKEQALQALMSDNATVQSEIQQMADQLSQYALQLGEYRVKLHAAEDNRTRSASQLEQLQKNREQLQKDRQQAVEELEQVRRQLAETEEALQSAQNAGEGYAMKLRSRSDKHQKLVQELAELRAAGTDMQNKIKVLRDLKDNMEGFAYSVKKVSMAAKEGKLRGILGPVAQLLSVDSQYATAIEVALGGAAQHIVCTDEAAAKAGIRFLKETRGGRATFLPQTTIRPRSLNERGVEEADGFVGIASALVRCEADIAPIAQNILGKTVVAEDLDAAAAMAKRFGYRFRVVTLDGQVVNAGGSFTGGHLSKSAGVFSRQSELDKLSQRLQQTAESYRQKAAEEKALGEEVAKLTAIVDGAGSEKITFTQDKIRCEGELAKIEQYLQTADRQLAAIKDDGDRAAAYRQQLESEISELGAQQHETRQLHDELDEKLASLSGEAKAYTDRRQQIIDEITELKVQISGLQKDILVAGQEMVALSEQKLAGGRQKEQLQQQIESAEAQLGELEEQAQALAGQNDGLQASVEQCRLDIQAQVEARQALEQKETADRQHQRQLQTQKEELARELARLEERGRTMQQQYDQIIADLYDQYELSRSQAEEEARPVTDEREQNRQLASLKAKMRALGAVNVEAIEEYRAEKERYDFMTGQMTDVQESKEKLRQMIGSLTKEMIAIFSDNFKKIGDNFSRIFVDLFGGGSAGLVLTEPDNVLESGIEIQVSPPGKLVKSLQALSGGEQAFVAIAIYFAILTVHPSPFCILDEIEAALDDVNVAKYASYLRTMNDRTQFILITHRRGTMEESDVLYGVTMQEKGVSKLLKLDVSEIGSEYK
ncbi:chromosome segregation protein SMC [Neobittarella massiliensis]|uniref:chromosome segregation protein SMC n=1 Tax=Neobittarella massiliensis (ex Bilen et al. 2018) TaxID=2041842 RepID=UPI000CF70919|nr:chromosome segregation protein SMC [Neobittarella massiliensis]